MENVKSEKILDFILNRAWVKSTYRVGAKIMVELYEGYVFDMETKESKQFFKNVRQAASASSRNNVVNVNTPDQKPGYKKSEKNSENRKKSVKAINGNAFDPKDYVYPTVDRDSKGKVLSMTPNAIRKRAARAKAKAAK